MEGFKNLAAAAIVAGSINSANATGNEFNDKDHDWNNSPKVSNTVNSTKKDVDVSIYGGDNNKVGVSIEGGSGGNSKITLERSDDHKKASITARKDINNDIYVKGGLAKLKKDETISGNNTEVTQDTFGVAVGAGDDKTWNIEAGAVRNKLSNAGGADGNADTVYVEGVVANDDYEGLATVKNTKVFGKDHTNYSVEAGYKYNEDCKISARHDSIEHDASGSEFYIGAEYSFNWDDISNGEWNSKIKVTNNVDKHTSVSLECGENDKSLKDRDEFEDAIENNNITAKQVDSEDFDERTKESNESINASWMNIGDASVEDGSGGASTPQEVIANISSLINNYNPSGTISIVGVSGTEVSQFVIVGNKLEAHITSDVSSDSVNTIKLRYTDSDGNTTDSNQFNITVRNVI